MHTSIRFLCVSLAGAFIYAGTAHAGKTGVENSFEMDLHGDVGFKHIITNARGRHVPADSRNLLDTLPSDETPDPGANIYLSLDLDLQLIATKALEGKRGAVVAIDPWSGEILALVSAPAVDYWGPVIAGTLVWPVAHMFLSGVRIRASSGA
jgi:penicillin-binding protein 2